MTPKEFIYNLPQYITHLKHWNKLKNIHERISFIEIILCFSIGAILLFSVFFNNSTEQMVFMGILKTFCIISFSGMITLASLAVIYHYVLALPQAKKKYLTFQQDCSFVYHKKFYHEIMKELQFTEWTKEEKVLFANSLQEKSISLPFLQLLENKSTQIKEKLSEKKKNDFINHLVKYDTQQMLDSDFEVDPKVDAKMKFKFF